VVCGSVVCVKRKLMCCSWDQWREQQAIGEDRGGARNMGACSALVSTLQLAPLHSSLATPQQHEHIDDSVALEGTAAINVLMLLWSDQ
jgi:hypothetical protein